MSLRDQELFQIDGKRLTLIDGISYDQWLEAVKHLKSLNNQAKVYLADAIEQGTIRFGKIAVDQGLQQLEFDMPTIKIVQSITGIPKGERDERLEPEHYVVLAKAELTPAARKEWIKKTAEQGLSPAVLKASIPAGEVVSPQTAKQVSSGVYSPHGIRGEFDIWLNRVGGEAGVLKMAPDARRAILVEFIPIASLVKAIQAIEGQ